MYVKAVSVETCEASNVYTVIPKRKNKRGKTTSSGKNEEKGKV
jgi:hypothetical protein